jgi:hypothetical protein
MQWFIGQPLYSGSKKPPGKTQREQKWVWRLIVCGYNARYLDADPGPILTQPRVFPTAPFSLADVTTAIEHATRTTSKLALKKVFEVEVLTSYLERQSNASSVNPNVALWRTWVHVAVEFEKEYNVGEKKSPE